MSEKDIRELLQYETNRGKIRQLTEKEIKEFHKKFNETLENSDYYYSLDSESDAAYSYRDDVFDEMIAPYKIA